MNVQQLPKNYYLLQMSIYDYDKKICELYGDAQLFIICLPKDRTFGEMRRDIYYAFSSPDQSLKSLNQDYCNNRLKLKQINKEIHSFFYKNKQTCFSHLLNKYIFGVNWNNIPKKLKFKVTYAKIIDNYDGNSQGLLAEDDKHFYYVSHSTS